jgi:MoxR-like ATPase
LESILEHFAVVQSLCRIGLAGGDKAFRQQVERLCQRLKKAGDAADAETLERLLNAAPSAAELAPTKVEVSRFHGTGESLTHQVHPPVDRETAQPLCRIVLNPGAEIQQPLLSERSQRALTDLVREWQTYGRLQELGVAPGRSCLIFGPPGTGKTMTAYHLTAALGLPLINARIDGLISSFLGTTARNIANLFAFANRYQCVLLLDEFDAIAKIRDDPQEIGEIKRVVNSLLQNLDDRANIGITIAITNHHELLDNAVWRRFENQIQLGIPESEVRTAILRRALKPLPIDENLLSLIAYVSEGRSAADLLRMANAIKRLVALSGKEPTAQVQFELFREAVAREPSMRSHHRAAMLADDLEQFVVAAMSDPAFGLKQKPLGTLLAVNQTTISRWINRPEAQGKAHAQ